MILYPIYRVYILLKKWFYAMDVGSTICVTADDIPFMDVKPCMKVYTLQWQTVINEEQGGISSSVLSVFFTDKFALSQTDARISVAYNSCQWKTLTKRLMKCPPGVKDCQVYLQEFQASLLQPPLGETLHLFSGSHGLGRDQLHDLLDGGGVDEEGCDALHQGLHGLVERGGVLGVAKLLHHLTLMRKNKNKQNRIFVIIAQLNIQKRHTHMKCIWENSTVAAHST